VKTSMVLVLVAMLAACGPKSAATPHTPPPADASVPPPDGTVAGEPSKDPLANAVESNVKLYEMIAALPESGQCPEVAVLINRMIDERAAALAQVREAAKGAQAALVDGLFHDASPRLSAAMTKIDALATRCVRGPDVSTALARLSVEGT
jgi:predicted small lipoprotein YifL